MKIIRPLIFGWVVGKLQTLMGPLLEQTLSSSLWTMNTDGTVRQLWEVPQDNKSCL